MTRKAAAAEAPGNAIQKRVQLMAWVETEGAQLVACAQLRRACVKRVTGSPVALEESGHDRA